MSYTKVFMRIKLKELANEVRLIKAEERKTNDPELKRLLANHRMSGGRGSLKAELRATQLFLAFLRGTPRSDAEVTSAGQRLPRPVYERLRKMQQRYEPTRTDELTLWLRWT